MSYLSQRMSKICHVVKSTLKVGCVVYLVCANHDGDLSDLDIFIPTSVKYIYLVGLYESPTIF